ncbi:Piso0_004750 [Millerozyma farinosa CBS 7064]|uniref:Piso0_004750 protein n=1 Tax=Pichia sorbitophila (strain ATCC MYA-4447 / BCRC 22081 / CBS 7064 / NBRC 10061 / NRRL Y-12695) TaxID=559304 RepID=G8Y0B4_PICSO|nr:Piso0_004750 [Millerozyma farinosa CBS 7064]
MSGLTLYTWKTPNGYKISIFLELLGLKYDTKSIDISKNTQKEDWFLKLNPNGRIPTLVDDSTGITISETGAILQYLADFYDKEHRFSYPKGTKEYYLQLETLYFQMAGVGPMQGQANHFIIYAPEKIPYGVTRYINETKRLYSVVEEYLRRNQHNGPYLVGNHYCISDIALVGWANYLDKLEIDMKQWPLVTQWFEKLKSLPEVQKGFSVPS